MAEWKITRRRGVCTVCERDFEDGERHVSILHVHGEGLERADICLTCREKDSGQSDSATADSATADSATADSATADSATASSGDGDLFWWTTRYQVERKQTVQLDLESLERLFLELEGTPEPAVQELRYVLCLILMRKRRLKVERVLRNTDGEAFLVKRPRRDQRFEVRVFDFTPERMAEIRTQLQAIFDGAEDPGMDSPVGEGDTSGASEGEAPDTAEPEPAAEVVE